MSSDHCHRLRNPTTASIVGTALLCLGALTGPALSAPAAMPQARIDIRPVAEADPGSSLAPGWQHGAFMEIFVRAFSDSDGDGIGDLRGLTQRLDYLRDLGIKGIWLMPITRNADGDHGYAVTDFRSIDPAYGTLADFDELIRQAHARGIGVIMDYVLNHGSAKSSMFVQASASRKNRFRDWYLWQDPAPTGWEIWGKNPWHASPAGTFHGAFYGTFGAHMPDFNLRNPMVLRYHHDSLRFWLNRGLDGFRFDAVPHLVENSAADWNDQAESYALVGEIHRLLNRYRNRHMVCEATASPQVWALPQFCGSAFAFGMESKIVEAAEGKPEAVRAVARYFDTAPPGMAAFVSNHDAFTGGRLWDHLAGDEARIRLAAATYLLLPGTPFLYYGEEIGMAGAAGLSDDPKGRGPMSWTTGGGFSSGLPFRAAAANVATHNVALESADPASLLSFYRTMLALRNRHPAIAEGGYASLWITDSAFAYRRNTDREEVLVLINYGLSEVPAPLTGLAGGAALRSVYPEGGAAVPVQADGSARVTLPAQSLRVFQRELK
jgi:glycosidase